MAKTCACGGTVAWEPDRGEVCSNSGAVVIGPLGTYFDCPKAVEQKQKVERQVAAVRADGVIFGMERGDTPLKQNGCVKCGAGSGGNGTCGDCYTEPAEPEELGPLFDEPKPLTHAQVAEFRSAAIRALNDYRNALALIDAKAPALDRVANALTALGA